MTPGIHIHTIMRTDGSSEVWRCPLYGVSELHALAEILSTPLEKLQLIGQATNNYDRFKTITGGKLRHVTAPCGDLIELQRTLSDFLERMGHPDYLHSGLRRRSHVTHAGIHLGQAWLCKIDLRSFFLAVTAPRIRFFFSHRMSCSSDVASLLTRLCTVDGHLPIGGLISQELAFQIAKPMFDELNQLAVVWKVRFSVYVDDLCFSGNRATPVFLWRVKQIIHKHGFRYHGAECYAPGKPRVVTGVLLTNRGMRIGPALEQRIREHMSRLDSSDLSEKDLNTLLGLLAAAKSIEPRFKHVSRAVQKQAHKLGH